MSHELNTTITLVEELELQISKLLNRDDVQSVLSGNKQAFNAFNALETHACKISSALKTTRRLKHQNTKWTRGKTRLNKLLPC
tara:strand:+ start:10147 stop:10395 length:249 start_codon:yes stop_codon:yes gene_type:complete